MNLEEEKAKLDHEHDLTIRRIWLEKGLLALVLGLVLAGASFGANYLLENAKEGFAERRHTLEVHERILTDLRRNYDNLTRHTYTVAHMEKTGTAEAAATYASAVAKYKLSLDQFKSHANASGRHFTERFQLRLIRHLWFHEALAFGHRRLDPEHWGFAVDVFDNFGALTTHAYSGDKIEIRQTGTHGRFQMLPWGSKEIIESTPAAFLDALYVKWYRENNQRRAAYLIRTAA